MREEIIFTWQRERREDGLVPVREDFFTTVQRYLLHLETMSREDDNPVARQIFKKLYTRTSYLVNDLIDLRAKKIFLAALNDTEVNVTSEEKNLFTKIHSSLLRHRRVLLGIEVDDEPAPEPIVEPKLVAEEAADELEVEYCTVEFLENELEVSLGTDLLSYGPFYKGDFAVIPVDNASELEKRNKVRILNIGN